METLVEPIVETIGFINAVYLLIVVPFSVPVLGLVIYSYKQPQKDLSEN